MNRRLSAPEIFPIRRSSSFGPAPFGRLRTRLLAIAPAFACAAFLMAAGSGTQFATAQAITIDTGGGKGPIAAPGQVDRQFSQITPTHVDLPKTELDPKSRILLERDLQSDQGFANRPFPRGHKGLTLQANGKLEPAGVSYLNMVVNEGLSAKPGTRVVVSNIKIDKSRIILDFDGGPDAKHRFLRHLQIGLGDPQMGDPDMDPRSSTSLATRPARASRSSSPAMFPSSHRPRSRRCWPLSSPSTSSRPSRPTLTHCPTPSKTPSSATKCSSE